LGVALSFGTVSAAATKSKSAKKAPPAAVEKPGVIDVGQVWRWDGNVFTDEQLVKLEPLLRTKGCKDDRGCAYRDDGRRALRDDADFVLIPWRVSHDPGYLVRADRCVPGGCDQGLFVRVDGRWRLLVEAFGILDREEDSTHGFRALLFYPRGAEPVRLEWDGRAYREP
jgi:hypothetical protein